ncbi:DUF4142 domain-containing protein [Myxococcus landrumensis]|uniref:DUF4142 domain-containing protein n=1 Tax=Myxococcus landrumensis TaxID=2813577 RepID=A0ABX7MZN3_9BACT|nr:DUF4142 domain-containing protein [Myxococcus landrumus]QSQ11885.1 DUF4142 domain-containing protein [Myxococcus landrumus]
MTRRNGWMLAGMLFLGGAAGAQNSAPPQNGTGDSQGMIRAGEADAIDQGEDLRKQALEDQPATGGSGEPDAQAQKWMKEGLLPVPTDEKSFLEILHHGNQMEIQMGQLAQKNGASQDVKDFGARMEREHGKADQKLLTYAKSKGFQLGEPQATTPLAKAMGNTEHALMEELQLRRGPTFDRGYLAVMVGDHDSDIAMVMAGQQQFSHNTELKGMLDETLTMMRQHRQSAYKMLGQETPRQARQAPRGGR